MTKEELDLIDIIVDLVFDKHCREEEIKFECWATKCDDLSALQADLKKVLRLALKKEKEND